MDIVNFCNHKRREICEGNMVVPSMYLGERSTKCEKESSTVPLFIRCSIEEDPSRLFESGGRTQFETTVRSAEDARGLAAAFSLSAAGAPDGPFDRRTCTSLSRGNLSCFATPIGRTRYGGIIFIVGSFC